MRGRCRLRLGVCRLRMRRDGGGRCGADVRLLMGEIERRVIKGLRSACASYDARGGLCTLKAIFTPRRRHCTTELQPNPD